METIPRTETVTCRVTPEQKTALVLLAQALNSTPSAVLGRLVPTPDRVEQMLEAPPLEPSADERQIARQCPSHIIEMIEAEPKADRRRTLVAALFISCGSRADDEARSHSIDLMALGDRLVLGDAQAIEMGRQWVTEHILIHRESWR